MTTVYYLLCTDTLLMKMANRNHAHGRADADAGDLQSADLCQSNHLIHAF